MAIISFRPKQVSKKLLSSLKDRSFDVIANRYGLTEDNERKTLEAIGQKYGITRERVRQIENTALNAIRKSKEMEESKEVFSELKKLLSSLGAVVSEEEFLDYVSKDKSTQNHIHLYMVLGDDFYKHKEDEDFRTRWSTDEKIVENVHKALSNLYASLGDDELVVESKIIEKFLSQVKDMSEEHRDNEIGRAHV